jgi:hypothetical protein
MKPRFLFPEQRKRTSPASSREGSDLDPRRKTTYLKLIVALLTQLELDPKQRGSAGKVKEIVERAGLTLDEQTIRSVLQELDDLD